MYSSYLPQKMKHERSTYKMDDDSDESPSHPVKRVKIDDSHRTRYPVRHDSLDRHDDRHADRHHRHGDRHHRHADRHRHNDRHRHADRHDDRYDLFDSYDYPIARSLADRYRSRSGICEIVGPRLGPCVFECPTCDFDCPTCECEPCQISLPYVCNYGKYRDDRDGPIRHKKHHSKRRSQY